MTMPITEPDQIQWHVEQIDEAALKRFLQGYYPLWNIP
jgi:hypothetical protein